MKALQRGDADVGDGEQSGGEQDDIKGESECVQKTKSFHYSLLACSGCLRRLKEAGPQLEFPVKAPG